MVGSDRVKPLVTCVCGSTTLLSPLVGGTVCYGCNTPVNEIKFKPYVSKRGWAERVWERIVGGKEG